MINEFRKVAEHVDNIENQLYFCIWSTNSWKLQKYNVSAKKVVDYNNWLLSLVVLFFPFSKIEREPNGAYIIKAF